MKTPKKLAIKKVTLRDLDEPALNAMAGGLTKTCIDTVCGVSCKRTCPDNSCPRTVC